MKIPAPERVESYLLEPWRVVLELAALQRALYLAEVVLCACQGQKARHLG